jgi:hypothetical protein
MEHLNLVIPDKKRLKMDQEDVAVEMENGSKQDQNGQEIGAEQKGHGEGGT